jgi:dTDP-4-amino-4,6-dideoxygalactose transaminase
VAALVAEGVAAVAGYIPKPVYAYPLFQNHNFFGGGWPLRDAGLTTMDYRTVKCPVAETMLNEGVSLPISPALTDEIIDQTATALAKVARHFAT